MFGLRLNVADVVGEGAFDEVNILAGNGNF
jgi:hypothetical protein